MISFLKTFSLKFISDYLSKNKSIFQSKINSKKNNYSIQQESPIPLSSCIDFDPLYLRSCSDEYKIIPYTDKNEKKSGKIIIGKGKRIVDNQIVDYSASYGLINQEEKFVLFDNEKEITKTLRKHNIHVDTISVGKMNILS